MSSLRRLICSARGNKKTPMIMATMGQLIFILEHRLPKCLLWGTACQGGQKGQKKEERERTPESCRIRLSPPPRVKCPQHWKFFFEVAPIQQRIHKKKIYVLVNDCKKIDIYIDVKVEVNFNVIVNLFLILLLMLKLMLRCV